MVGSLVFRDHFFDLRGNRVKYVSNRLIKIFNLLCGQHSDRHSLKQASVGHCPSLKGYKTFQLFDDGW